MPSGLISMKHSQINRRAHEHIETMGQMLEDFRTDNNIPLTVFVELLASVTQEFRLQRVAEKSDWIAR